MVRVYADGALIYDPNLDGYELEGLTATASIDKAGTAEIVMPAGHPAYNAFVGYRTVVEIHRDGGLLWRGRAVYPMVGFNRSKTITCEGERNFLRDAVIEPYLYQASPAVIFSDVLGRYNAQVDAFKRFRVGKVTAEDPNGYIRLESEQAEQISDIIDKLVERVGGYITFSTASDGTRLINWLGTLDEECGQVIEFGENLLDYTEDGANTELATVIYPYGAKDDTTGEVLGIEAVNGGKPYIVDAEAVKLRGWIAVPVTWDDVTVASNLLRKARQYLATSKLFVTTVELSAVDLSVLGGDIEPLRVGCNVRVRSAPHGVDDVFLLRERSYDLLNPAGDTVVLGADRATLTGASVGGDKNTIAQLRRSEQATKIDYTISITDAVARSANK